MKRRVLFYWLVLLVSVLAIGGAAFYLLQREKDRLYTRESNTVKAKAQEITQNLDFLVEDEKRNLLGKLAGFSDMGLSLQMTSWREHTTFPKSVVLFRPNNGGLVLPLSHTQERVDLEPLLHSANGWIWDTETAPTQPLTPQQTSAWLQKLQASIVRPAAGTTLPSQNDMKTAVAKNHEGTQGAPNVSLPNGGQSAASNEPITANGVNTNSGTIISSGSFIFSEDVSSSQAVPTNNFARVQEADLPSLPEGVSPIGASSGPTAFTPGGGIAVVHSQIEQNGQRISSVVTVTQSILPPQPEEGWVTIGPPDDLSWFGWFRPVPYGPVRGVVLNWKAMESNLLGAWPLHVNPGEGFVLRNPEGNPVVWRVATNKVAPDGSIKTMDNPDLTVVPHRNPLVTLRVPEMPGWTLDVFYNPPVNFVSGYMLGTMLLATLVVFVVVGGTLLMREARREAFDAARKTTFVSNVSHELKTPLTTIRMYAELLGEGRVRDPGKQRNYLATIIGESQRLTRLVNNVLDFSRLEQGHKKYNSESLALADIVENVIATHRPRLDEAGFECELHLAPDAEIQVRGDRDALEQVMLNLLDNALKYAAEGRWLGVRLSHDAEHAILTVSDHGTGVPPEHRERIFEMFHRVDDAITAKQPGTGLGLSIARRLLRDQGGDLRYEPNKPCGASFVATIPLAATVVPFEAAEKQA